MGHLRRRFGSLLLLQLPYSALALFTPESGGVHSINQMLLAVALLLPVDIFLSNLTSIATLWMLEKSADGPYPTVWESVKNAMRLFNHWWVPATLLCLLLYLPIFANPWLSFISAYFITIYGYAPFIRAQEPNLDLSLAFGRAKKLVKPVFWPLLILHIGMFAINQTVMFSLSPVLQFAVTLLIGFLITPFLTTLFLDLRSKK